MQQRFSNEGRQLKYQAFYRKKAEVAENKFHIAVCFICGIAGFMLGLVAPYVWKGLGLPP